MAYRLKWLLALLLYGDDLEWALLDLMIAAKIQSQPLRLSGHVTPASPGGQSTALLPDGTPVCRHKYLSDALDRAAKVVLKFPRRAP